MPPTSTPNPSGNGRTRKVIGSIGNSHLVVLPADTVQSGPCLWHRPLLVRFVAVFRPVVRGRALFRPLRIRRQMRECKLHRHGGRAHQYCQQTDEFSVSNALQNVTSCCTDHTNRSLCVLVGNQNIKALWSLILQVWGQTGYQTCQLHRNISHYLVVLRL